MVSLLRTLKRQNEGVVVVARYHLLVLAARLAGFRAIRYVIPSLVYVLNKTRLSGVHWAYYPLSWLKLHMNSFVQRLAIKFSNPYVFSELAAEQVRALVPKSLPPIKITKPGIDSSRFYKREQHHVTQVRASLALPLDKKLVLFAGRFIAAKGLDLFIETLSYLDDDTHLVMVGEGELEADLQRRIIRIGMSERVHMIPKVQDIERYYACCDVFAMTSTHETFGQTIIEAMASGLAVAAFSRDAGVNTATEELGLNEFIAYSNEFSALQFAKAIERQMLMPDQVRRIQSLKTIEKYSWERLLNELLE
jgi:glycosyltransferase involved in cell wall biosynthesis